MHSNDHPLRSSRVDQRTQDVVDGSEGEGFPDGSEGSHGRVVESCEEEGEAGCCSEDGGDGGRREGERAGEGEEEVGGSGGGG